VIGSKSKEISIVDRKDIPGSKIGKDIEKAMAIVMGTPLLNSSLHCNRTSTANKILSQMLKKLTNIKFKRLFLNNSTVLDPSKPRIHTSNSSLTRKSSLWPNTRKIVLVEKLP
jgi:hypothetical protein